MSSNNLPVVSPEGRHPESLNGSTASYSSSECYTNFNSYHSQAYTNCFPSTDSPYPFSNKSDDSYLQYSNGFNSYQQSPSSDWLQPKDCANFAPFTLSSSEIRTQLDTIGRQLNLQTVASSGAPPTNAASGHSMLFMLYLCLLGLLMERDGRILYVEIPSSSSSTSQIFSGPLPIELNGNKRSDGGKLSIVNEEASGLQFIPTTSTDDTSDTGPSAGSLPLHASERRSGRSVSIEFGSAVSISLELRSPSNCPGQPTHPSSRLVSSECIPQLLPMNVCFIRFNSSSAITGIRIRIVPETVENTETWIDLPGVWIHTTDKMVQGSEVIGFSGWFYTEQYLREMYQKILVDEMNRKFEQYMVNVQIEKHMEDKTSSTFDQQGNLKPKRKTLYYPSGDDMGVNWSATLAENDKIKRLSSRPWEERQQDMRDVIWLHYLWKQHALIKGWEEQPKPFGDRVRNEEDTKKMRAYMEKFNRGEPFLEHVQFFDMEESLNGEKVDPFRWRWRTRK